jgi:threonine dehydratase
VNGAVPSRIDVEEAAARIGSGVRRTPVIELDPSELEPAATARRGRLVLKLELLQHTGSFKARGALNNVLALAPGTRGVCAASGGNHGAAVAWAASRAGHRADVFAPASSTPTKLERIEEYGAVLHRVDGHVGDALAACQEFGRDRGVPMIHPYDTFATVAGAGTLGLELHEQVPELDRVVIACGGGGLYAGVANALADSVEVQPVEPELCPHLNDALDAGEPVDRVAAGVAADALGPLSIGRIAFETARVRGSQSVLVPDDAVEAARRFLWQRLRVLAEPAASVPLAAVMTGAVAMRAGETLALVISGGNNSAIP